MAGMAWAMIISGALLGIGGLYNVSRRNYYEMPLIPVTVACCMAAGILLARGVDLLKH